MLYVQHRSGEEGLYPELIEFTEKRLATVYPKRYLFFIDDDGDDRMMVVMMMIGMIGW
jgi:hypothetical protein